MKICVYTCITGNYDKLKEPEAQCPGMDFICFTDNKSLTSKTWKMMPIPKELVSLSKVKQQRIVKICPHKYLSDYDVSIWVDGNLTINGDLNKLLAEIDLQKTPLYTRVHPARKCVYEEAKAILRAKKDKSEIINPIIKRYESEGMPKNAGMAETNVIIRRHNDPTCIRFCNQWAAELMLNSHRDQMSFNYVCWMQKFLYGTLKSIVSMRNNKYFGMSRHGR